MEEEVPLLQKKMPITYYYYPMHLFWKNFHRINSEFELDLNLN